MTEYERKELRKVCTPTEVKFIEDFEKFLKTHKHGKLELFGHSGSLSIEKPIEGCDGTLRLRDISGIRCDGGDPNNTFGCTLPEGGEYITLEDYNELMESDAED